jgi:predicted nucleic acid-binding protein
VVFADSSGFIAAFDARDQRHGVAAKTWKGLARAGERFITTQLVVVETVTHVRRRAGWEASRLVGDAILSSVTIEVIGLDAERFQAAWREFLRDPDPKLSLCDAASFVVMRERGIRVAFTFDHHFAEAGFELVP